MISTNPNFTSALPAITLSEGKVPISIEPINQTTGGWSAYLNYQSLSNTLATTRKVWEKLSKVSDRKVAGDAEKLIGSIENTLSGWASLGFDLNALPELQMFSPEDGSILLEWGSPLYRVGFSLEPEETRSSWYLVSTKDLGQIGASGYIKNEEKGNLVKWLLDFMATNT